MLQQDEPDDYVLATGETHSVREFVELAFAEVGRSIDWRGKGVEETGVDASRQDAGARSIRAISGRPRSICCSAMPARRAHKLGWQPKTSFARAGRARWWRAISRSRGAEVANGKQPRLS